MEGMKLGFTMAEYAKKYHYGLGSFRLKDGSSVKILHKPDEKFFNFLKVKDGRLYSAEGGKGNRVFASLVEKYSSEAQDIHELDNAVKASFTTMA